MHDDGQGVDPLGVDEDVQLDQRGTLKMTEFIIKRGVAAADRFQAVEEIEHHLGHGQRVLQ